MVPKVGLWANLALTLDSSRSHSLRPLVQRRVALMG